MGEPTRNPLPRSKAATAAEAAARAAHEEATKPAIEKSWDEYHERIGPARREYDAAIARAQSTYRMAVLEAEQKLAEASRVAVLESLQTYYAAKAERKGRDANVPAE
jgi:hypothetical protein